MYAHGPGVIAESVVMSCAVCANGAGVIVEYRRSGAGERQNKPRWQDDFARLL
jgi:hypothetical protein